MATTRSVLAQIQQHGSAAITGPTALVSARRTLQLAMDQLGVAIVFDPVSAPDLVDALAITTVGALEGAAAGAAFGLVLGLLTGSSSDYAGVGALLGGLAGAARGAGRVDQGWRVRAVRDHLGAPVVFITREFT